MTTYAKLVSVDFLAGCEDDDLERFGHSVQESSEMRPETYIDLIGDVLEHNWEHHCCVFERCQTAMDQGLVLKSNHWNAEDLGESVTSVKK